ncbi:MAG: DUF3102 domain-containing protein [Pirellulales bacterium]
MANNQPGLTFDHGIPLEILDSQPYPEQAAGKALDHAMQCGDLFTEAKSTCKNGEWQGWLNEHFDGSSRTARVYMRVADNRELIEAKRQSSAILSIDGAVKLLAASKSNLPDFSLQRIYIAEGSPGR